ncbi:MAG: phosphogluconate dehydrogenase [Planctomycetaceae bacterium]|nr:phosphogluconate dehydrogenase [Planctomycetaceae bacterium]MBP62578.1 phosphogluconate dehydrogenase [Planctomycetaceae bacterium]
MEPKQLGILHPGSMGASVGAAANNTGTSVYWASENRSEKTARRAEVATFKDLKTMANLVGNTKIIICVCPPSAATTVAEEVARHGFRGIYVDANAISPARAERIGTIVQSAGANFVDGGIVGEPAWKAGTTRLYLCGSQAPLVSECFRGSNLEPLVIDAPPGAASALKMAYAAYTKGTTALLTAVLAVAEHEGVRSHLQHEWSLSQTTLSQEAVRRVCKNTFKAWRFEGEMREIAATFSAAGLPGGFHDAAAEIFRRLSNFKGAEKAPHLEEVVECLLTPPSSD